MTYFSESVSPCFFLTMSIIGKPPKDLDVSDDPKDFLRWKTSFENYIKVVDIGLGGKGLDSANKHSILLNCLGDKAMEIVEGFTYDTTVDPYENLMKALETYFVPKVNLTYERYQFRNLKQTDKVLPFLNELQNAAKKCDFKNDTIDTVTNQNIRDQFVLGIQSEELRRQLLSKNELSLEQAKNIALSFESSTLKCQEISANEKSRHESHPVLNFRVSRSPDRRQAVKNVQFSRSPLKNKVICFFCKKEGHIQRDCFLRKKQNPRPGRTLPVDSIFTVKNSKSDLKRVKCSFFDCEMKALVDTGASVSVVSKSFINRNKLQSSLKKCSHTATTFNGDLVEFSSFSEGPLEIYDGCIEASFFVSPNLSEDAILGMDVLNNFRSIQLNPKKDQDLVLSVLPNVLSDFQDVFDKEISESCIPFLPESIIKIKPNTKPYQAKIRKFSPRDEEIIKTQVNEMLEQGVIVRSSSSWRHSPVVVPKRTGGFRLAIDYRPVNSVTQHDAFPIPGTQQLIESLEGCKVFSSLDFSQFYYQLPLAEEDREKTAFYACGDLFHFTRVPFGLKNAVSYCCRRMRDIFKDIDGISLYLDDLLIHAETKEKHDEILQRVLERIRENNMSLNLKKCSFYQTSVSFLGHLVSEGKISPDPDRTKSILTFPTPKTSKQLQRFLGMANFFRNYVKDYAEISSELYNLSLSDKLSWTERGLLAFNEIKDKIAHSILYLPTPEDQLLLHVDASESCVGACLVTDKGQPVSFASKKLSETQKRWSVLDKEAFAIVWSIQKFRNFLLARKFVVFSDHKPLKYLFESN